jgi:predicted metalloendopeptidase
MRIIYISSSLQKHTFSDWPQIDTLDLQIGFPPNLLTKEYRERYYSKLYVQKNDFFQNIQYGVDFLREIQQERLASPSEEHRWVKI